MKRESTEQIIASALERLLDQGIPFEKITVANIIQECEASKTTFYNYFKDKYDLMVWYLKDQMLATLKGYDVEGWTESSVHLAQLIADKAPYYKSVIQYKGQNSFESFIKEYSEKSFRVSLTKALGTDVLPKSYDYAIKAFMAGSVALMTDWINNGCEESPVEFTQIMIDTAPKALAFYFEE